MTTSLPTSQSMTLSEKSALDDMEPAVTHLSNVPKEDPTQENHTLKKRFGFWSLLGYQLSIMASWSNYLVIAGTYVFVGGPVAMLYGSLVVGLFQFLTALCLAEFTAIWPHAGGSQYWITQMSRDSNGSLLSYLTGWMNILAFVTGTASANFAGAQTLTGLVSILTNYVWPRYQIVLVYWGLCLFNIPVNAFPRFYNAFNIASLVFLGATLFATIGMWASSLPVISAKDVFSTFINQSGWSNNGYVFVISLTQATYAATALDATIHLAQETKNAKRTLPRVLACSVPISTLLSFGFAIFLAYRMGDFANYGDSSLGEVYLTLYADSIGLGPGLAIATTIMLTLAFFVASQTMTGASRLIWAMSMANGVPYSRYWAHVDNRVQVPMRAFWASFGATLLLGLLYLGGDSAWNAIASSVAISYQLVYVAPAATLLYYGRHVLPPHNFNLGKYPYFGITVNTLTVLWGVFISVVSLFPVFLPATGDTMNYAIVVFAVWALVVGVYWVVGGKKKFVREQVDEVVF